MTEIAKIDFLKHAFALGQQAALEKSAGVLGGVASWLGRSAAKAAPSAWRNLKSVSGFGGHVPGTLGSRLSSPLRPLLGKAGAQEALGFGMLGGGIGAVTADEGERLKGFGKGLGLGTISGAGWNIGGRAFGNVAKRFGQPGGKGFRGALGTVTDKKSGLSGFGQIMGSELGVGRKAGLLGTKALTGGCGLAAGMGLAHVADTQAQKYIPSLRTETPAYIRRAAQIPAAVSSVVRRGPLGLSPGASPGATVGTTQGAM